jgi:predicted RNA-binding protein with PUA-like domain
MSAGGSVWYGNTHLFQHASKVHTCKVAGLNRNQASQYPEEASGNTAPYHHPDALDENERHQDQQRSHGKDWSRNQAGEKVKCDHGYQIFLLGWRSYPRIEEVNDN